MTYVLPDARLQSPGLLVHGQQVAAPLKPDMTHPLAVGLRSMCIGHDMYDFAAERAWSRTAAIQDRGSWYFDLGDWLEHTSKGYSGPITMGSIFIPNISVNSNGRRVVGLNDDSSSFKRSHISCQYNGTTTNSYRYAMNDGSGGINIDINVNNAAFNGTVARVGIIERWTDRVLLSVGHYSGRTTNATSKSDVGNSFDYVGIGSLINGGTSLNAANEFMGHIQLTAIWERDLGEDVLKEWLRNPGQMLIPR